MWSASGPLSTAYVRRTVSGTAAFRTREPYALLVSMLVLTVFIPCFYYESPYVVA